MHHGHLFCAVEVAEMLPISTHNLHMEMVYQYLLAPPEMKPMKPPKAP